MNISKLLFAGIITALVAIGCNRDKGHFSVSGKITHAEGQTIYFEELGVSSSKVLDSVKINKNGEFKFTGETSIPTYYLLKLSEVKLITLLVDSVEQVFVEADAANFGRSYRVEGSLGSLQVKILNDHLARTRKQLDSLQSLNNLYAGNPDYPQMKKEWDAAYDSIREEQTEFSKKFIMSNPFSMAGVLALYQQFDNKEYVVKDLQTMRVAASALHSIYPNSAHVKALYQNTLQILQEEQSAKLRQFIQEKGENSPDIVLPNSEGKEIALSSLRGKIVLLQFWSAVDRNSRIQNEALVDAYRKYKNKGFEIYQVSVDENRIEWVDAIDQDGLKWINVGDMEGSNYAAQVYNIQSIPYNYLLNKEGAIIARDLKGPALDKALSRILN
ncbi:AhpC/TSA family protein [Mariniphaga sediminis]|jgi:peroxiredoxin|uniref:AhpC/TSA family protein n=1 Tax=Mariniphaga sediminis TaxID=1628158 RepID=A0A399D4D0_9BACT|nr:TlpA disulfide reductase family protein [Mariniphaga sediminis]RIH66427.1 AhpC/TSA family protein [Mariniphaga sediminis]